MSNNLTQTPAVTELMEKDFCVDSFGQDTSENISLIEATKKQRQTDAKAVVKDIANTAPQIFKTFDNILTIYTSNTK